MSDIGKVSQSQIGKGVSKQQGNVVSGKLVSRSKSSSAPKFRGLDPTAKPFIPKSKLDPTAKPFVPSKPVTVIKQDTEVILTKKVSTSKIDQFFAKQKLIRTQELSTLSSKKIVKTVKDGGIEHKLNNPDKSIRTHQMGMVERQQKIMDAAKKADPLMRELESSGSLSETHHKSGILTGSNRVKQGVTEWNSSDVLVDSTSKKPMFSYGAEEFGNRPVRDGGVETTVPTLKDKPTTKAGKGDGVKMREGRWSEADLSPRVKESSSDKAEGRDGERLLFTSEDTVSDNPLLNNKGTGKIEHKYHVTVDHYDTSVPISPVQKNYKQNNPYTPKYSRDGSEIKGKGS